MHGSTENCYHYALITSYSVAEEYSNKYDTGKQSRYE